MKWLVHNYGEQGSGWEVEVEAETEKEAIEKAPYDWQDPTRHYYGAKPMSALDHIEKAEGALNSMHQGRFLDSKFPPAFMEAIGEIAEAKAMLQAKSTKSTYAIGDMAADEECA